MSSIYTKMLIDRENRTNKHRIVLSSGNDHRLSLYIVHYNEGTDRTKCVEGLLRS